MENNKEIKFAFASMASNGQQAEVEIHAAAVKVKDGDKEGLGTTISIQGGGRDIALVVCNIVNQVAKSILEKEGVLAAAKFVDMIGSHVTKGAGSEATLMAALIAGDTAKKLFEEMEKEEGEDDGEPV